jgi:ABC-type phosphate/phosphonate transport system substrate-binding protein
MIRRTLSALALFALALSLPAAASAQPKQDSPIKVGMVNAFFTDLPEGLVKLVTAPFPNLMKQLGNLDGALTFKDDAFETAAKLDSGKLDLGVFHGHELAWLQKKYPKMKPLMVIVNKQHDVRAYVIVKQESPFTKLSDLRGKTIDLPSRTKEHCRIYLGKHFSDNALGNWQSAFGKVVKSPNEYDAIDDVSRGKADAVVVDTIALDFYKAVRGPVFAKNLRILDQSDAFPAAVIVYKDGAIPAATLKQFCDGLISANKSELAGPLLKVWSIDGFELPPANYQQCLDACLKAHPAPPSLNAIASPR